MPAHLPTDPLDPLLDQLLRAERPARKDFTDRTLERIRSERFEQDELLEEFLDQQLSAQRIEPRDDFTARTLARIHERSAAPLIRFPFPLFVRTAAGLAAAIAVLLSVGGPDFNRSAERGSQTMASLEVRAPQDSVDAALATLLMLAEGLDNDARWLLHGQESTALLALAH